MLTVGLTILCAVSLTFFSSVGINFLEVFIKSLLKDTKYKCIKMKISFGRSAHVSGACLRFGVGIEYIREKCRKIVVLVGNNNTLWIVEFPFTSSVLTRKPTRC